MIAFNLAKKINEINLIQGRHLQYDIKRQLKWMVKVKN